MAPMFAHLIAKLLFNLVWTFFGKGRALKTIRGCASELKLTPGGFSEHWDGWDILECYDGLVDGLSTAVALATHYEEVAETKVKVAGIFVKTKAPGAVTFHYEIGRPLTGISKNFTYPDATFSGATAIKSDNGAMLATLLENVGLRSLILNFLGQGKEAVLNEYSGWMELARPYALTSTEVAAHVRRTARVVRALHDRAAAAGFLRQSKAA